MNLNPLTQINPVTMTAIVVIFIATYFALKKIYFDKYVDFIESRDSEISKGRAAGLEAEAITVKAKTEAEEISRNAQVKIDEITTQNRSAIYEAREEIRLKAAGEAEAIIEKGRVTLPDLKAEERAKMQRELGVCIWQVVRKLDKDIELKTVEDLVRRNIGEFDREAGGVNG